MRVLATAALGLLIAAGCKRIERRTKTMPRPLRAIDNVLDGNADNERVRRLHGVYTTALDGLGRAAQEADDIGATDVASELGGEARRLDAVMAIRLTARAARSM